MFSFLTGGSKENVLDIKVTPFDPVKETHRQLIKERIKDFEDKEAALKELDKKYGMAIGIDVLLWASSALNGWISIAALIGIGYAATQVSQRSALTKAFDESAKRLFESYTWCTSGPPSLSHDLLIHDVLKHLLPYALDPTELLPWDLAKAHPGEIEPSYLQIFADSPHKMIIVTNSAIFKSGTNDATHSLDVLRKIENNTWGRFFNRVKAEGLIAIYARRFTEQPEAQPLLQLK